MSENSSFSKFNNHINDIMISIASSKNIVSLLCNNSSNVYDKSIGCDPYSLLYEKIHPCDYVPDTQSEVGSHITVHFDKFSLQHGMTLRGGLVIFEVFCHRDIVRTDFGSRLFLIYEELDKIFNKKKLGVGDMYLVAWERITSSLKYPYVGHRLIYELKVFD